MTISRDTMPSSASWMPPFAKILLRKLIGMLTSSYSPASRQHANARGVLDSSSRLDEIACIRGRQLGVPRHADFDHVLPLLILTESAGLALLPREHIACARL